MTDNPKTGRRMERKNKNLAVLTEFMNRYGLSTQTLGKVTGHDKTNYVIMLSRDDTKISTLEKIFEAFGCNLEITIEYPGSTLTIDGNAVTIPGMKQLRRLAAIDTEMRRRGINMTQMSEMIGVNKFNVINWFKADDCKMSSMIAMCEAMNVQPHYHLTAKKGTEA